MIGLNQAAGNLKMRIILVANHNATGALYQYRSEAQLQSEDVAGSDGAGDDGHVHPLSQAKGEVQQIQQESCSTTGSVMQRCDSVTCWGKV